MAALLEIKDFFVRSALSTGEADVLHDISFSLGAGQLLAILGESGSGKTILCRAITRLFSERARLQVKGVVVFDGRPLLALEEQELAELRRTRIRYVFQEPLLALNPLARIRAQMVLAAADAAPSDEHLVSVLESVGISNALEVLQLYPHELSTGMAQRVMIAMALLPSPALLIADEPTSSVDVALRHQLLDLLRQAQRERKMAMILITHDLFIAREHADQILLLYKGRIVESGGRADFFGKPSHPYAQMLLEAEAPDGTSTLLTPGVYHSAPLVATTPSGCTFISHCPRAHEDCAASEPLLEDVTGTHKVRCYYWR
jgi:oligopeptide/dipeptide ABC transporter ATP-binding protein